MKVPLTFLWLIIDIGVIVFAIATAIDPLKAETPGRIALVWAILVVYGIKEYVHYRRDPGWYGRKITWIASIFVWMYRSVVCLIRGHDLEPEVTKLKVFALPCAPSAGPPTSAYRRPGDDHEPQLGLMLSRGRLCRRCGNTVATKDQQP